MTDTPLFNASSVPLNVKTGTVPDLSGALKDWFQPMVFVRVQKSIGAFQNEEVAVPINFQGVIQPLTERALQIKPEGQRAWTWFILHAEPGVSLNVDEVVDYLGVQTRIMSRKDFSIYGYMEYHIVQDWTGAGP